MSSPGRRLVNSYPLPTLAQYSDVWYKVSCLEMPGQSRIKTLKYPDFSTNYFPNEEPTRSQMNEYESQYEEQKIFTLFALW